MSFALHKELLKSSNITYVLSGRFVEGNRVFSPNFKEYLHHQVLLVRGSYFEVYDVVKVDSQDENISSSYKYNFLVEYKVSGNITSVEKMRITSNLDCVVLVMDYAKIAILEYDCNNRDFRIMCLYNFENENLSNGKKFYRDPLQVTTSQTYDSILILSNDVTITFLAKKFNMEESLNMNELEQIKYLDTVNGDLFFEPSFYINFREFGVDKIIKYYCINKENELMDYFREIKPFDPNEKICVLILYRDSGFSSKDMLSGDGMTNQPGSSNFYKYKVNLAICYINKISRSVENFEVLFENLDQYSFDLFCLSMKITVILAPYCIQVVNFETKICFNLILNQIYYGIFHREYTMNNVNNVRGDITYINLNLDLRGGGYLAISNTQWIFSTSKGSLYVFSFMNNFLSFTIDQIHTQQNKEITNLEVPYKFISMPHPGIFLLGSYFTDAVFIIYENTNYHIGNKFINISPIINFTSVLDRYHSKFIFTSGFNKQGSMNFIYEKLFYDISFFTQEYQEIAYLKTLNFQDEIYSRYLLISLKNGKSLIYEIGKTFENITEKVSLNQGSRILSASIIKLQDQNDDNSVTQFVCIGYENLIQIFNSYMKMLLEIPLKQLISDNITKTEIEDKIKQFKIGENSILLNTYYDKFIFFKFENILKKEADLNLNTDETSGNDYTKLTIKENIVLRYKNISQQLASNSRRILKFDLNSKLIHNKTFLTIYRDDSKIEIYDLSNHDLSNPFFENNLISELPVLLSDMRIVEYQKDFEKCLSDLTLSLNLNSNTPPHINPLNAPEEIFFDILDTKIIFSIVFKNGTIVFYEVFFILRENKLYSLKMVKFNIDFIENIDYREFFYSDLSNSYIRFENINEKCGVLLNIKGHQKILFEINGRLKFLEFENNHMIKRNFSAFAELSKEDSENGFIFYENGILTIANIPKKFEIKEIGLIKRNQLGHFPVNMNYLVIPQERGVQYFYITIEKELKLTTIKSSGGSINLNKFYYYMCLRTEDPKLIDQYEFPVGEVIVESKIVELLNLHKVKTKYIAVGINYTDERGEEVACKAKLQLFNIENGKFVTVLESELRGVISMIQSIDGVLIVAEGSKIYLYQYVPLTNEIKKISVIENNKNLVVCSKIQSKFIITGDIFESASWIVFKHDMDINNSSIYILGKDQNKYHSVSIDFWIDDTEETFKTGCIISDEQKNLHIFLINTETSSPNMLSEVADIHLGKRITELKYFSSENKSLIYYSADDGSIGILKPITKISYDRLSLLCEFLYNHLPFRGGLNPKMFYSTSEKNISYHKEKGNILDMDILNYYLTLPITTQKLVAKNVVLSRETIIHNINEIKN